MTVAAIKDWKAFRIATDAMIAIFVVPAGFVLWCYRKVGSARLPLSTRLLRAIGVFPIRDHYYEPLFQPSGLLRPLSEDRNLPGIDLNVSGQLRLLDELTYASELVELRLDLPPRDLTSYCIRNGSYEAGDAEFLYQFVRAKKPAKIVEIGSGNSTKIACLARLKNAAEGAVGSAHVCIEPYEQAWLEMLPDITVVRKRLEECVIDWTQELSAGDLLFVDSSHMIRPQGDVLKEYLEIFPQIPCGVFIHIHDIFTPQDYPTQWVVDEVRFWNEQYLLEALLSNTARYEVVAGLNFLKNHHYDRLKLVCPYLSPDRRPGSFYVRVR